MAKKKATKKVAKKATKKVAKKAAKKKVAKKAAKRKQDFFSLPVSLGKKSDLTVAFFLSKIDEKGGFSASFRLFLPATYKS